jgi:hypothetical protein
LKQFAQASGPITICDGAGQVRAVLEFLELSDTQPQITEEEIARRIAGGGGRKLVDILHELEEKK